MGKLLLLLHYKVHFIENQFLLLKFLSQLYSFYFFCISPLIFFFKKKAEVVTQLYAVCHFCSQVLFYIYSVYTYIIHLYIDECIIYYEKYYTNM